MAKCTHIVSGARNFIIASKPIFTLLGKMGRNFTSCCDSLCFHLVASVRKHHYQSGSLVFNGCILRLLSSSVLLRPPHPSTQPTHLPGRPSLSSTHHPTHREIATLRTDSLTTALHAFNIDHDGQKRDASGGVSSCAPSQSNFSQQQVTRLP